MQVQLASTTAVNPLGSLRGRVLLKVPSPPYAGKLLALTMTEPGLISFISADPPGSVWTTPTTLAEDAEDGSLAAAMDSDGNVQVAYVENVTHTLVTRRLTFQGDEWSVGPVITVFNADSNSAPSLAIDINGRCWVSWSRFAGAVRYIHAKYSNDDGATWGSSSADSGDQIHGGGVLASSRLVLAGGMVHVVYYYSYDYLCIRSRPLTEGAWSETYTIASGSGVSSNFDAIGNDNGRVGVAWTSDILRFREFDGDRWSPVQALTDFATGDIQAAFHGDRAFVFFLHAVDTNQARLEYVTRSDDAFGPPTVLDSRNTEYAAVLAYHHASESFADLTESATIETSADLFHPQSNALLAQAGDAVYVGLHQTFRFLHATLTTPGVGGTIAYSYWNGTTWVQFVPVGGTVHFNSATVAVRLWDDYRSIPPGWQKSAVEGQVLFWLKIETVADFTTAPVGSELSAISGASHLRLGR